MTGFFNSLFGGGSSAQTQQQKKTQQQQQKKTQQQQKKTQQQQQKKTQQQQKKTSQVPLFQQQQRQKQNSSTPQQQIKQVSDIFSQDKPYDFNEELIDRSDKHVDKTATQFQKAQEKELQTQSDLHQLQQIPDVPPQRLLQQMTQVQKAQQKTDQARKALDDAIDVKEKLHHVLQKVDRLQQKIQQKIKQADREKPFSPNRQHVLVKKPNQTYFYQRQVNPTSKCCLHPGLHSPVKNYHLPHAPAA